MPNDKEIKESIERILDARKNGAICVSVHDAMIIINAYREECFSNLGLEDYDGE